MKEKGLRAMRHPTDSEKKTFQKEVVGDQHI